MSQEMTLFDEVSGDRKRKGSSEAPTERRTKLRSYDATAAQLLNPYGASCAQHMSIKEIWTAVAEGSYKAMFHSELAATETTGGAYRVGVGLSRVAESLLCAITQLQSEVYQKVLLPDLLKAALSEGKNLEPHLKVLNAGKGGKAEETTALGFNKARAAHSREKMAPQHSQEQVKQAAVFVHKWLLVKKSPLRSLISVLSGHGAFYAAQMNDKVARGWVEHKPATRQDAEEAAEARRAKDASGVAGTGGGDSDAMAFFNQ